MMSPRSFPRKGRLLAISQRRRWREGRLHLIDGQAETSRDPSIAAFTTLACDHLSPAGPKRTHFHPPYLPLYPQNLAQTWHRADPTQTRLRTKVWGLG